MLPRQLVDSHCHLQDERLQATEIILAEAAEHGVQQVACNGCWQEDWGRVAAAARRHPAAVLPQFGLHPWWVARRSTDWLQRLRQALVEHPHAGLGECGLDRGPRMPPTDWEAQVEAFEQQLRLAEELQRPVTIHCVRAYGAVHDALQRLHLSVPVVLHSWTGAAEMTAMLLLLPNVYVSLSGHLTRVAPHKALPMVRAVPLNRLLLESDSPDGVLQLSPAWLEALPALADVPQQLQAADLQQLNRPCVLRWTLRLVAAALGKPEDDVAAATCANARHVFCSHGCNDEGGGGGTHPAD